MATAIAKRTAAVIVVGAIGIGSLAGCANVERSTGLSGGAQAGALTGAAAGGVIAGLAGAHPAWIAGSILMGAFVGGVIGDALTERDKEQHAETSYQAFESRQEGGRVAWNNPDSGNSGDTQIDQVYRTSDGKLCKDFTQTINADGQSETTRGTACQQADGTWTVV